MNLKIKIVFKKQNESIHNKNSFILIKILEKINLIIENN